MKNQIQPGTLCYTLHSQVVHSHPDKFVTPQIQLGYACRFGGDVDRHLTLRFQANLNDPKADGALSYYAGAAVVDCYLNQAVAAGGLLAKLMKRHDAAQRCHSDLTA